MDPEEFEDLRQDTLEVFEEDVIQTLEYHEVIRDGVAAGGSPINTDFGFVDAVATPENPEVPKTLVAELLFSQKYQSPNAALRKLLGKASDEFHVDYDVVVYIPTADIDRKGVELKRDSGFFRLADGTEFRMEAIHPVPRMYTSSIITKVFCKRRKPIEDNPGVN